VVRTGKRGSERFGRTVHPTKPFARHHLEIDALITVLGIDKVGEPDRVKLLGYNAVEVDKRSRHPDTQR
jgi:hypothetical protein